MADVSTLRQVRPASCHLPVSWYFDPDIFALEKRLLFDAGPRYGGDSEAGARVIVLSARSSFRVSRSVPSARS